MTSGSSMLARIASLPPQRVQRSISTPKTRLRRCDQVITTWRGVISLSGSPVGSAPCPWPPLPRCEFCRPLHAPSPGDAAMPSVEAVCHSCDWAGRCTPALSNGPNRPRRRPVACRVRQTVHRRPPYARPSTLRPSLWPWRARSPIRRRRSMRAHTALRLRPRTPP